MKNPQEIRIEEYDYPLKDEQIALYPEEIRDESKLLISKDGVIKESKFKSIADYLPEESFLVLNNTKVVQARLLFEKETGSRIEVFCLEAIWPTNDIQLAFGVRSCCRWKCFVGNSKKWKTNPLEKQIIELNTRLLVSKIEAIDDAWIVEFSWDNQQISFAEIIASIGNIPLPPYIHRKADLNDENRYQTVYAEHKGSVAAPTAGLHFTDQVFSSIKTKKISINTLSLHVGAGTFKPVSSEFIGNHKMHFEQIVLHKSFIQNLLLAHQEKKHIIAVGTTSVRSLESLFWYGNELENKASSEFCIQQWTPYAGQNTVSLSKSLENILRKMEIDNADYLQGSTALMIAPPYNFKIVDVLITNFHQPKSTLLLLVSAFIGKDWKQIYEYALGYNFRFLSYGDSCLLFKNSLHP